MNKVYWVFLLICVTCCVFGNNENVIESTNKTESLDVLVKSENLLSGYPEPGGEGGQFGSRTVIQGDRAFVSAPKVNNKGGVYILDLDENGNWVQNGFIEPADGVGDDRFGVDVSVYGHTIAIAANQHDYVDEGICDGAVYLYQQQGDRWEFQQKINSPSTCGEFSPSQGFAKSVYLTDNQLFIGQITDNDVMEASGAVLVYNKTKSGWVYATKIKANEPKLAGIFGFSISVFNDWMLIGATSLDGLIGLGDNGDAYFFHLEGNEWIQKQHFSGNDNNSGPDLYGQDVHISTNRAFVGVPADDIGMRQFSGSVRVFELNDEAWEEVDILTAQSPNSGGRDFFGGALDVLGDYVLVGSKDNNEAVNLSGAAYLHRYTDAGLQEVQKYTANDFIDHTDDFATDVALHSNYVMAGKFTDNDQGFVAGSIYSFDRESEQQIPQKLTIDGVAFDQFGTTIEVSGNMAFVGAVGSDENKQRNSGVVYVFEYNGSRWNKHSELFPDAPEYAEAFGSSISISGNTAVIGAPVESLIGAEISNPELGSVYVFNYDGNKWVQTDRLQPGVNSPQVHFGSQVSLSGSRLIVGAAKEGPEIGPFQSFSSFFYFENVNGKWEQKQQVISPNLEFEILFGRTLKLIGDELLLSAELDDTTFNLGGAVLVYKLINNSWVYSYSITPDDHQANSFFGSSFSEYNNTLLVSSPKSSKVHFFQKVNDVWTQTQRIIDIDQYFARSVLITDSLAYISCNRMNTTKLCVYENLDGSWQESIQNQITVPNTTEEVTDINLRMFENQLFIGTPSDDTEGFDAGIVFGYQWLEDLIFLNNFE